MFNTFAGVPAILALHSRILPFPAPAYNEFGAWGRETTQEEFFSADLQGFKERKRNVQLGTVDHRLQPFDS
jgi:hypothetical protein